MATSKMDTYSYPTGQPIRYISLTMPPVRTCGVIVDERKSCKAKVATSLTSTLLKADVLGFRFRDSRVLMEWLQKDYDVAIYGEISVMQPKLH